MKDSTLEIIALCSIILGLILCFAFIFDYTPKDAFFLEEDDGNAMLDGRVIGIRTNENFTLLQVYSCREFTAYSNEPVIKSENENITMRGSFSDDLFIIEKYY